MGEKMVLLNNTITNNKMYYKVIILIIKTISLVWQRWTSGLMEKDIKASQRPRLIYENLKYDWDSISFHYKIWKGTAVGWGGEILLLPHTEINFWWISGLKCEKQHFKTFWWDSLVYLHNFKVGKYFLRHSKYT